MAKARVLVVEDEIIVAMDIQHRLEHLGYEVAAVVASGEQAMQQIEATRPDLILMDIVLTDDADGVAVAAQIQTRFNLPVVYLTAHADDRTLARATLTEPFGYILKPFEEQELRIAIEVALYKHRMEKRLKESEQWLATTLRSIGDAVITTDSRGCITFMNPVAEALTGWTQAEALGRELTDVFNIIHEGTRTAAENPAARVLREDAGAQVADHVLIAKGGIERPINDSAAPIKGDQGIIGVVLVFRDVTQERELQAYLARSERLRALGTMAAGVAHNFNNLLTSVLGYAQLLQLRQSDLPVAHGLKMIEQAARDGARMVGRLIDFTWTERDVLLDLVDCNQIVRDAIELTRPRWGQESQASGAPIVLETELGEAVTVLGHAGDLRQALVNLIFNAIEAMPRGGQLTLVTERRGDQVRLQVKDTGAGMDQHTLDHACDPFFSTKDSVGVGLGLTQCYHIAERHQGRIEIASAPGEGTTVTLLLPFATTQADTMPAAVSQPEISPRRVLIVDDDEAVREVLTAMLMNLGHQVVACADGPAALMALEREAFDLACIDLVMPLMEGWELIDIIKQRWPRLPVIVITGWMDLVKPQDRQVAIDGLIQKPFVYDRLIRVLSAKLKDPRT
jgi:hypothetical protein